MNVQVNKRFLKDLSRIPDRERIRIEKLHFTELPNYVTPNQIPNLSKLKDINIFIK
jgi:hypothetical protein